MNEAESKEDGFGPVEYIARKPTDVLLSISRSYTPTDDDIGSQLLCVCTPVSPQGVRGLTVVALVGATRRSRRRQLLDRQTLTIVRPLPVHSRIEERYEEVLARPTRPGAFRVMSYNVLFDNFVDSSWALENIYPYLAPEYASHEYRSQLVLNEILSMHPDVVCLQEMGHGEFHDYYQMHLARSGGKKRCKDAGKKKKFHEEVSFVRTQPRFPSFSPHNRPLKSRFLPQDWTACMPTKSLIKLGVWPSFTAATGSLCWKRDGWISRVCGRSTMICGP